MSGNSLGNLVLKAKGDRSYREYQKDSGVDAATISKMVKGTYIPKTPEVYRKLTNCESNGVTFEDLIDAAGFSAEYRNGMLAGAATSAAALTALGATSLAMLPGIGVFLAGVVGALGATRSLSGAGKLRGVEKIDKYLNEVKRFSAISNGILLMNYAKRGIVFQQNLDEEARIFDNQIDVYLNISNQIYTECIFRYLYVDESVDNDQKIVEASARRMIEELIFSTPFRERKLSIVTESRIVFDYLKSKKDEIAFRGNLSVILVDTKEVIVVDETVLTVFDDTVDPDKIKII